MPTRFEDDYTYEKYNMPCRDKEHNPPNMIVIPPGKKLVHTCPSCGKTTVLRGSQVTF